MEQNVQYYYTFRCNYLEKYKETQFFAKIGISEVWLALKIVCPSNNKSLF
jgi:hypothetical protein